MKVAIGSDHAGWKMKEKAARFLKKKGYEIKDFGCKSNDSCDYPDFALPIARAVMKGKYDRGILVCTTGIGMSIAANKVPGIRAALCADKFMARASREHNDANILVLAGRGISQKESEDIISVFLKTEFFGEERHRRRIRKIREIERKYNV